MFKGFYVKGRHLYDPCGEKVILRGVANPHIWFLSDALDWLEEIENTGANCVRIVWNISGSAEALDEAISTCIDLDMIPMIECHDATCDLSMLDEVVDYWTSDDILEIIYEHEEYLLINIANEAGAWEATAGEFRTAYESAILEMRDAEIHVPLIIDGTDCGKRIDVLQSEGPYLIGIDPDSNLIFSVHMWWNSKTGYAESLISSEITQSVNMDLPLIVGEFGGWFDWEGCEVTTQTIVPYKTIIEQCHLNQIGYIAWSWTGNSCSILDMSEDGTYETLHGWGDTVAVVSPYSIEETSIRPYFIVHNGECNPNPDQVETDIALKPVNSYELYQNHPNPFNAGTQIEYELLIPADITLAIYDITGKKIRTLVDQWKAKGKYTVNWNGINDLGLSVSSGIYIYELSVKKDKQVFKQSNTMILLK